MIKDTLVRLPTWQTRFALLCIERRARAFEWGAHDCCLWAADTVNTLTGQDFAADLRGTYATAAEASRVLKKLSGVRGIATAALGASAAPAYAAVGDIVLMQQDGRDLLAVCNGLEALCAGHAGLAPASMQQALAAWKV
jgi:hypothetical protein